MVELDLNPQRSYWADSHYPLPMDGPDVVEIQFIDVRACYRRSGIGSAVVRWVTERYPDRQVLVLSADESEGFWAALGWQTISPDDSGYRTMYASPLP